MLTMSNSRSSGLNPASGICSHCKRKPRRVEGATVHPYCGMACASLAKSASTTQSVRPPVTRTGLSGGTCQTPGCSSTVHIDQNGVATKYCSKTHRWIGRNGCISCRKAPAKGPIGFCQTCYNTVLRTAPVIVKVPTDHERYESVESQFSKKWLHNNPCPKIRAIYKIVCTTANVEKFQQYLDEVEAIGNFSSQNRSRGNENRRWHGTVRKCNLGDQGQTKLCADAACFLCGIIKTSFDITFSARNPKFKRFGVGIYTSATSSKAGDYSVNGRPSNWKAMLLNKVVVGKGYKTKVDNVTLTQPPDGFDSVIGEVGESLNYDELVVYNNHAILPSYLVMYDIPR